MKPLPPTILCIALANAIGQSPVQPPVFAPPVKLVAGTVALGEGRLFPSPVWHDMNGDGRLDVVVGDLRGHLTVALREPDAQPAYAKEEKVTGADGKIVDFHNW